MFVRLRKPAPGEYMENYIAYNFETGNAEIVLNNKGLLPRCFKILVERFIKRRTENK